jgi:NAD(P)-dependent dehydrogenase (short-subunit alcohol dehydrogenase family)
MDDLKEKVVLITGAGKGGGRSLAQALAARGAALALNDISPVNVEEVVNEIVANGGDARAYIEDVAKKVGAQHIVKQVEDDFGRIDILVNHASVEPRIPLLEMDEWDWHRVLDVNLTGAFLMTQSAARVMRARGSGVILNLITDATRGGDNVAAYTASMNGLKAFTHQAARELSPHGIHVHLVENRSDTLVARVLDLLGLPWEEP